MTGKKVVVAGATGLVGNAALRHFGTSCEVVALSRRKPRDLYGARHVPIDLTSDLQVDALDLTQLLGSWGPAPMPGCRADLDHDGVIGAFDLSLLLGAWGACR